MDYKPRFALPAERPVCEPPTVCTATGSTSAISARCLITSSPAPGRVRPIFFVESARNDFYRVVGQGPLQCLGFFPRRTHPYLAFFLRRQDQRQALGWSHSTRLSGNHAAHIKR